MPVSFYKDGLAYRDLDRSDGTPDPVFRKCLSHPSYDSCWQDMMPYRDDFTTIDIPVLQTAGYFFGGPGGAPYELARVSRTLQIGVIVLEGNNPVTVHSMHTLQEPAGSRLPRACASSEGA